MEHKPEQALRCYKRALALDPSVATAGSGGGATALATGPPSWLNNLLDAAYSGPSAGSSGAAAAGEEGGGAKPATPLRGEDSAAAGAGRVAVR